jgi:hypothetical protein
MAQLGNRLPDMNVVRSARPGMLSLSLCSRFLVWAWGGRFMASSVRLLMCCCSMTIATCRTTCDRVSIHDNPLCQASRQAGLVQQHRLSKALSAHACSSCCHIQACNTCPEHVAQQTHQGDVDVLADLQAKHRRQSGIVNGGALCVICTTTCTIVDTPQPQAMPIAGLEPATSPVSLTNVTHGKAPSNHARTPCPPLHQSTITYSPVTLQRFCPPLG